MSTAETAASYGEDFYTWSQRQARLLQEGRFDEADISNIAEEIESLGRSELRAAGSLTMRILQHLLYLRFSPADRPKRHWAAEVTALRGQLNDQLKDSPSLRPKLADAFDDQWRRARKVALLTLKEADDIEHLPAECPFTLVQVLDEDYFPDVAR